MAGSGNYEAFAERAMHETQRKMQALVARGLLDGGGGSWSVDQPTGMIMFAHANGKRVVGPVQFGGSFNLQKANWLRAWNDSTVLAPLRLHSWAVRPYGEEHGRPSSPHRIRLSGRRLRALRVLVLSFEQG